MTCDERSRFELDQWSLSCEAKRVVLLPGDGVGPEVVAAASKVLHTVAEAFDRSFLFDTRPIGAAAIAASGTPLPPDVLDACRRADAVLLGAVGGDVGDGDPRPEDGLLALRAALGVYANLRPVRVHPFAGELASLGLRPRDPVDLLIVRELTGGLYYGRPRAITTEPGPNGRSLGRAVNSMVYSTEEIERVAEVAFRLAARRRRRVTSVDKANVLEVSRLWRRTVNEVAERHPEVELEHLYVDHAAYEMVRRPARFDVVLTENLFGDILSDLAGGIAGSLGLLPSASVGAKTGIYEPVHGTAPSLAGRDRANPLGAILSAAMMLRHAFGWEEEAEAVECAVEDVLRAGWRTADLAALESDDGAAEHDARVLGTRAIAERVAGAIGSTVTAAARAS